MNIFFVIKFLTYYLDPLSKLGLMNLLKLGRWDFLIILMSYLHCNNCAYLKFLDKNIILISNASPRLFCLIIILFSVDTSKDRTIMNDAITSSSLSVMPIQDEELEKTSIYVNVFQWSHKDKPIKRVVHTWMVRLM